MSGLELIKNLKDTFSRALFIVVSGYAEFAFAQKAIKYGAFGYCLKPFDDEEIIGYLKKAKRLLEETTNAGEKRFLELIEDDSEDARKELKDALDAAGIRMDSEEDKYIVVSVGKIRLNLERLGSCISLKIGYNKYVYVLQTGDESHLWGVLKEAPADIRGIGVSNLFGRIEELRHAIDTAELRAYHPFATSKDYVAHSRISPSMEGKIAPLILSFSISTIISAVMFPFKVLQKSSMLMLIMSANYLKKKWARHLRNMYPSCASNMLVN